MNAFQNMINQIFEVPQFREYFTNEQGQQIVCVSYEVVVDPQYTEYGVDDGVSLHLTCKVADYQPKKGDKITFRNRRYKIDSFTADSFNLTYKIFLKDLTSR